MDRYGLAGLDMMVVVQLYLGEYSGDGRGMMDEETEDEESLALFVRALGAGKPVTMIGAAHSLGCCDLQRRLTLQMYLLCFQGLGSLDSSILTAAQRQSGTIYRITTTTNSSIMSHPSDKSGKVLPTAPFSLSAPINLLQKRKRELDGHSNNETDTSKPTAVFNPSGGRAYTLSVALPGSIIAK